MPADCDCGTCCDRCGHTDDCIRHSLTRRPDVASLVAAEDGYPACRAAIRHPSHAATRRHFAAHPMPRQTDWRWSA
ncbi:hypothetical protein BJP40_20000 [Streptomyces sp. CC53]|uniref:hypothetical protein n=1 Tax=unclassified Streptomyces TaxID=2593676 RepID=UPI0008DE2DCA|nr:MULTISPECIES: hypothetical protein [unclassified Streptomyces]OII64623.1 hypothetical protein BJP40_20000 [Streptomyces sp. CC53]